MAFVPWVDERRGEGSDRDDVEALHVVLAVEEEREKLLAVSGLEAGAERGVDLGTRPDSARGSVPRTPFAYDLELVHG